jgi:ABC-type branched-subunit amino acid transport system substrate-binding protein
MYHRPARDPGGGEMICTHCGYANGVSDQICANCGSWLPEISSDATGFEQRPPFANQAPYPDGDWREAGLDPAPSEFYRQQSPGDVGYQGILGDFPADAGQVFPSPWQAPDDQAGMTPESASNGGSGFGYQGVASSSGFDYPSTAGSRFDFSQPLPATTGATGFPPAGPLALRSGADLEPQFGAPALPSGPSGLGALLKNGRYRVIQPFAASSGAVPPGNEPPLMIAHDSEAPNTAVLIQELRFDGVPPEDAEYARHLTAQRLVSLSYLQGFSRLVDSFGDRGRQYLVFEYPSGDLLSDRLRRVRGPLPETTAIGVAMQILDVLAGAERERPPFIHGNICPGNVILRPSGQLSLVGMSATLLVYPEGERPEEPAGGVAGYGAPEQARGQASMRSDLHAVCAILYHAMTGASPDTRASAVVRPAHRLNPAVSLELEEVLNKGMRPSPAQRFQSVAELREALTPLALGQRVTHAGPSEALDDDLTALAPVRDARGRFVTPRQPFFQNPLFLIVSIVALVAMIGGGVFYALGPHGALTSVAGDPGAENAAARLFQEKGIGVSYGARIFDSGLANNTSKQQGARLLAEGNQHGALEAFTRATVDTPTDPEAAIYAENARVLVSQRSSVTLVAAIAFSADPQAPNQGPFSLEARSELQGVFLAQQRINATNALGGELQLRVLIMNSGAAPEDVTLASNVLLDAIRAGNAQRIIGIVGWPETRQTQVAISSLGPSGLAILSSVANGNSLGGTAANYFAIVPSLNTQAAELADAAVTQLKARRILIVADPNEPQGNASATAFAGRLATQYAGTVTLQRRDPYDSSTTTDFSAVAADAFSANADLVYFAGSDLDAVNLAHSMARQFDVSGRRPHILATPRDDVAALVGLGADPVADAVRKRPADLGYLYVATPAHLNEWPKLSPPLTAQVDFGSLFTTQFGGTALVERGVAPNATTILSFDAARLVASAAVKDLPKSLSKQTNWTVDPTAVRTRLRQFDARHPFMGLGGALAFTITGSQPQKALAILAFEQQTPATPADAVATASVLKVVGGREVFCGDSSCQLTQ